ncbi:hypothetical protein HYO65_gp143 [Tenacibaculum phage PTm1]|uniref:Uncharacterized protein n=2 Tax=Shirahamavirus PTm1 TaxID=2846435 RepID=A0A5S9BZD6_9CAUD|nr:hypothetical protein HYO65_gp143 [Tenacibaculum phage PTm1]BBI90535.1 hypothetical protein [Tenacibaculum phage PTm1]BBI90843.1 hypothetical protein [Tenacibaculum phage PTm5]
MASDKLITIRNKEYVILAEKPNKYENLYKGCDTEVLLGIRGKRGNLLKTLYTSAYDAKTGKTYIPLAYPFATLQEIINSENSCGWNILTKN